MGEEILSLSTVVDRPTINITSRKHPKGKLYELVNLADLGPFEYAQVLQRSAEADRIRQLAKPTSAQRRQMEKAVDDIVRMLVPRLEPDVLGELTAGQKELIVVTWSARSAAEAGGGQGEPKRRRRTTGG